MRHQRSRFAFRKQLARDTASVAPPAVDASLRRSVGVRVNMYSCGNYAQNLVTFPQAKPRYACIYAATAEQTIPS